jgi:hypothetical protein
MDEIIGSLAGVSGHTSDIVYDLFFTTERVIAVIMRHPADVPYQFTHMWRTIFFGDSLSMRKEQTERDKIAQTRHDTSQGLSPDELVAASPMNFDIRYRDIASAEITHRLFQWRLRFHVSRPSADKRAISFTLSQKQVPEARRLLEKVLPPEAVGK